MTENELRSEIYRAYKRFFMSKSDVYADSDDVDRAAGDSAEFNTDMLVSDLNEVPGIKEALKRYLQGE